MPKRRSRKREEEVEDEVAAKARRPRTAIEPKPRNTGGDGSGQICVDQLRGGNPMTAQGKDISPTEEAKKNFSGDFWQATFLVGTEWDQMDTVHKTNWDFSNLEDSFEEGGSLYGKNVYLFCSTEPQYLNFQGQSKMKMIWIPTFVAVVSPFPPSDKVGITSIQLGESVVPMKKMKMGWVPYIPYNKRHLPLEHIQTRIHTLTCTQRKAALKKLHEERIMQYHYCLPYFYNPLKEDKTEANTNVTIIYPSEPPVVCNFDWVLDNFEAKEARQKAIEEISPEIKAAFENMRFYKFYPIWTLNTSDVSEWKKSDLINRYYGNAHEVL